MGAGRKRGWWRSHNHPTEILGTNPEEIEEDEDGRFESEGSERRVPSEGHVEGSDRTEI